MNFKEPRFLISTQKDRIIINIDGVEHKITKSEANAMRKELYENIGILVQNTMLDNLNKKGV
jgi:hypothetical protein